MTRRPCGTSIRTPAQCATCVHSSSVCFIKTTLNIVLNQINRRFNLRTPRILPFVLRFIFSFILAVLNLALLFQLCVHLHIFKYLLQFLYKCQIIKKAELYIKGIGEGQLPSYLRLPRARAQLYNTTRGIGSLALFYAPVLLD